MRRIILIVFWLSVFGALAFLTLSKREEIEQLEVRSTGNIQTDHVDRIWFSPRGELVGIGQNESQLIVRVWSGTGGSLIRERTLALPPAKIPAKPIFAVSGDASQAAWVDPGGVRIASLISPERKDADNLEIKRRIAISALAFTGPGRLAALYQDGELEIWDLAGRRVSASTHLDLADPGVLVSNGASLAAYSSASGNTFVFDTAADRFSLLENKKYPLDILSLTLSPQARFAVGTRDSVEQQGHSMSVPGPVRSLAFYDRNRVVVAGDFRGIYLLGAEEGPQQLAEAEPGASVLASAGSSLAFGNGRSLALASGRMVRSRVYRVSSPSPWLLIALFGLLTTFAVYFFYGSLRSFFRKFFKLDPPEEHAPKPPEEGPIPNALVEACLNGDCVLWAGSGLSAQAGLPTWSAFLRELVVWASEEDRAPASVTGPALAQLSEGKSGAAADRIAAAFVTRETVLHDYLRQRFRVNPELSEAHRLVKEIDFPALITTNLDFLLDRAFPYSGGRVYTASQCEELVGAGARRDFLLLKPFGDLDEPHTIRIGPAQCAELIKNNVAVSEFIGALFQMRVVLFIGASLEGLEQDLANLNLPAVAPGARKHYALVPTATEGWEERAERLRQRYAIEPLTYSPSMAHLEVVEFLAKLIGLMREKTNTQGYFEAAE